MDEADSGFMAAHSEKAASNLAFSEEVICCAASKPEKAFDIAEPAELRRAFVRVARRYRARRCSVFHDF